MSLPRMLAAGVALLLLAGLGAYVLVSVQAPRGERGVPEVTGGAEGTLRLRLPWSGAECVVPRAPARVLPGSSAIVDLLHDLLPPERFAAIPAQAFEHGQLVRSAEAFRDVPRFERFSAEELLAFRPDLVLASPFSQTGAVERLRELGVAVLPLPAITSLEGVCEALLLLGEIMDQKLRAEELVRGLRARAATLSTEANARPLSERPRLVSWTHYGSGGWTAGKHTSVDAVFQLAGARNAAAEVGIDGHEALGLERLLEMNPDGIVVASETGREAFLRVTASLGDEVLPARRRILIIDGGLLAANSQLMLDAAEVLQRALASSGARDGR